MRGNFVQVNKGHVVLPSPEDVTIVKQAIIPKSLPSRLMKIGHEEILSSQLGIQKSLDRIWHTSMG